jgi:hypothetical protein
MITELGALIRAQEGSAVGFFSPGNLRGFLGVGLREWFRQIPTGCATAYATLANDVVQPGDVIITFNYDDSLERELKRSGKWDLSRGYGFPLAASERSSQVLTLKLHGSMNWLVPIPLSDDYPVIHQADVERLGYSDLQDFTDHLYQIKSPAIPCLILPDRDKKFSYDTTFGTMFGWFWDHLWEQAITALRQSQRLVVCGYSLLPVDQRACSLLLKEPPKETRITIVSGSQGERIASDFRSAGFQDIHIFESGHFEEWVQGAARK